MREIIIVYKMKKYKIETLLNLVINIGISFPLYFRIMSFRLSHFKKVIMYYFERFAFQKRWNCREMGNTARVTVTKAQPFIAAIVIRRKNIEWNKIAINTKHQTIRGKHKHISRRQSGAREIGTLQIPK